MPPQTRANARRQAAAAFLTQDLDEIVSQLPPKQPPAEPQQQQQQHAPPPPTESMVDSAVAVDAAAPSPHVVKLYEACATIAAQRVTDAFLEVSLQDPAHKTLLAQLCASIGGASSIGHRTCHCIWGPPGSGKRRLLSAVAKHFARDSRTRWETIVMVLETTTLANDDDAMASMFEALRLYYLRVHSKFGASGQPGSGSVNMQAVLKILGRLFESVLPAVIDEAAAVDAGFDGESTAHAAAGHAAIKWQVSTAVSARLFAAVGITALDALQHALVDINQVGVSLVVVATDIREFARGCDRVAYMLSGLMHECQSRAGGVSLVCASGSSDFAMEKRLSSRLCCEMWHCPMPRISVADVVAKLFDPPVSQQDTMRFADAASNAEVPLKALHAAAAKVRARFAEGSGTADRAAFEAVDAKVKVLGRTSRFVREFVTIFISIVDPVQLADGGVARSVPPVEAILCASPVNWSLDGLEVRAHRAPAVMQAPKVTNKRGAPPPPPVVVHAESLGIAFTATNALPREAVLVLCVTVMQHRKDSRTPLTLQETHAIIAGHFPSERSVHRLMAYGEGLDVLLERGIVELTMRDAIVIKVSLSALIAFLGTSLSTDEAASRHGLTAERSQLKGMVGV